MKSPYLEYNSVGLKGAPRVLDSNFAVKKESQAGSSPKTLCRRPPLLGFPLGKQRSLFFLLLLALLAGRSSCTQAPHCRGPRRETMGAGERPFHARRQQVEASRRLQRTRSREKGSSPRLAHGRGALRTKPQFLPAAEGRRWRQESEPSRGSRGVGRRLLHAGQPVL